MKASLEVLSLEVSVPQTAIPNAQSPSVNEADSRLLVAKQEQAIYANTPSGAPWWGAWEGALAEVASEAAYLALCEK